MVERVILFPASDTTVNTHEGSQTHVVNREPDWILSLFDVRITMQKIVSRNTAHLIYREHDIVQVRVI